MASKSSTSRPRAYDACSPFFISRLNTSKRSFCAAWMSSALRLIVISKSLILTVTPARSAFFQERLDSLFYVLGLEELFKINLFGALKRLREIFQPGFA